MKPKRKKTKLQTEQSRLRRGRDREKRKEIIWSVTNGRCACGAMATAVISTTQRFGTPEQMILRSLPRFNRLKKYLKGACYTCAKNTQYKKKRGVHGSLRYQSGCRCAICRMGYRIDASTTLISERLNKTERDVSGLHRSVETESLPKSVDKESPPSLPQGENLPQVWHARWVNTPSD